MLAWLKRRNSLDAKAGELYGKVVAAARQPGFYGPGRVPDTPEGRLNMIALHLFLAAERVKTVAPDGNAVAQRAIEAFIIDLDDCMREMGIGDLTVPKQVKRAVAAFYERGGQLRRAIADVPRDDHGDPLLEWIASTLLNEGADAAFVAAIAAYIRSEHERYLAIEDSSFASGQWSFESFLPPCRN